MGRAHSLRSELLEEVPLDENASRRIAALAAATGGADVVDGHVALLVADRNAIVLTSDAKDLAARRGAE